MRHQIQPNAWSCLATAYAICLNVPVEDIFKFLEHDGSEIIYPKVPEPYCRRSFHPQELMDYCYCIHNRYVMQIENEVALMNSYNEQVYNVPLQKGRVEGYVRTHNTSVLSGQVKGNGRWHAVAYVGGTIYDPNGTTNKLSSFICKFNIETLFLILT